MTDLHDLVRSAQTDVGARVVAELRARLLDQPHEWVVDQLLGEIAPRFGLVAAPVHRVTSLPLTRCTLADAIAQLTAWTSERLAAECCLLAPPAPGGPLIGPAHRSPLAEVLLAEAKDLLHALLLGDEAGGVRLRRVRRCLLTLAPPADKAAVFGFLGAEAPRCAEFEFEFGEVEDGLVGSGVVAALRLINRLEVNEVVLYARVEDVAAAEG
ncbi:hypothetical protein [Actinosynnema sp.]|uniref:hypothetical protein n=1 Tax=Actinosynnema sp. TaxID=1872144 RepID=UPI003F87BC76